MRVMSNATNRSYVEIVHQIPGLLKYERSNQKLSLIRYKLFKYSVFSSFDFIFNNFLGQQKI